MKIVTSSWTPTGWAYRWSSGGCPTIHPTGLRRLRLRQRDSGWNRICASGSGCISDRKLRRELLKALRSSYRWLRHGAAALGDVLLPNIGEDADSRGLEDHQHRAPRCVGHEGDGDMTASKHHGTPLVTGASSGIGAI